MSTNDLSYLPASQLAQRIRERQVSAVEVVETHLNRITLHNSTLNAIGTVEGARQRAKEADIALAKGQVGGPLHGVPLTIKDAFETAGLRTTCSYKPLADHIPQQDATVVARLRQAGAIILGKTNLPTMASGPQADSPIFGRANNPWDTRRTPGGSTGGGAAASPPASLRWKSAAIWEVPFASPRISAVYWVQAHRTPCTHDRPYSRPQRGCPSGSR